MAAARRDRSGNMSNVESTIVRLRAEPLPDNLRSVQPGGGFCYRVELAWGRWRRWYLHHFRPGYVRKMAALAARLGDRRSARNPRSARSEVLPQSVRLRLGPGGGPLSVAGEAAVCPLGLGRIAVDGLSALGAARSSGHGSRGIGPWSRACCWDSWSISFATRGGTCPRGPGCWCRRPTERWPRSRRLSTTTSSAGRRCGSAFSCRFSTSTSTGRPSNRG